MATATWCEIDSAWHKIKSGDPAKTECEKLTANKAAPKVDPSGSMTNVKPVCATCKAAL